MMPGAATLGGYADVRLDAQGDVINGRTNFVLGTLLVGNTPVDPTGLGGFDPSNFAQLDQPNVFQQPTTVSGLRFGSIKLITPANSPYTVLPTDSVILANCSNTVVANLPPSTGNGQLIRIRKIAGTEALVVNAASGDLVGGSSTITITDLTGGYLIDDAMLHFWDVIVSGTGAVTSEFAAPVTFNGINYSPILVNSSYTIQPTDSLIIADATSGDLTITLPFAVGTGRFLHIKKIDSTVHLVTVARQGTVDLIDGSQSVVLNQKGADVILSDDGNNYWDNWGPVLDNVMTLPMDMDKSRIAANGEISLYNPDMATFHAIRIRGASNSTLYLQYDAGV